jgi:Na+-translocating ferredoxin:NAD+ oxidoreductase RnfA subunit
MIDWMVTAFGAALAGNLLLEHGYGTSAALATGRKSEAARVLAVATGAVVVLATPIGLAVRQVALAPIGLDSLGLLVSVLVVTIVARALRLVMTPRGVNIYASCEPLIIANSAVLSVALTALDTGATAGTVMARALGGVLGYLLVSLVLAALGEEL